MSSVGPEALKNGAEGRAAATNRMFHSAWPASSHPALRVSRGSGFGAVSGFTGEGPWTSAVGADDEAQAETASETASAKVSLAENKGFGIRDSGFGNDAPLPRNEKDDR